MERDKLVQIYANNYFESYIKAGYEVKEIDVEYETVCSWVGEIKQDMFDHNKEIPDYMCYEQFVLDLIGSLELKKLWGFVEKPCIVKKRIIKRTPPLTEEGIDQIRTVALENYKKSLYYKHAGDRRK